MAINFILTWSRNTDDTVSYEVWKAVGSDVNYTKAADVPQPPSGDPTWTDPNVETTPPEAPTNLVPTQPDVASASCTWAAASDPINQPIYYKLRAVDAVGNVSDFSVAVYKAPTSGIKHYEWQLCSATDHSVLDSGVTTGLSITTSNLGSASTYYFKVRAIDKAGNASQWAISEDFGKPNPPTGLTIIEEIV